MLTHPRRLAAAALAACLTLAACGQSPTEASDAAAARLQLSAPADASDGSSSGGTIVVTPELIPGPPLPLPLPDVEADCGGAGSGGAACAADLGAALEVVAP